MLPARAVPSAALEVTHAARLASAGRRRVVEGESFRAALCHALQLTVPKTVVAATELGGELLVASVSFTAFRDARCRSVA